MQVTRKRTKVWNYIVHIYMKWSHVNLSCNFGSHKFKLQGNIYEKNKSTKLYCAHFIWNSIMFILDVNLEEDLHSFTNVCVTIVIEKKTLFLKEKISHLLYKGNKTLSQKWKKWVLFLKRILTKVGLDMTYKWKE
jgi:hypothetical protein